LETTNYHKTKIMKTGISINNVNTPVKSWEGLESNLPIMWSGQFQYLSFTNKKIAFGPDIFLFREASKFNVTGGITGRYYLQNNGAASFDDTFNSFINIFGRIGSQKKIILGIIYSQEKYNLGLSYELPFGSLKETNKNAFEVMFSLKPLINSRKKKEKKRKNEIEQSNVTESTAIPLVALDDYLINSENDNEVIEEPTDSVENRSGEMTPGMISSVPVELYTILEAIYFEFNSSELNQKSKAYLNKIYRSELKNSDYSITLIGHTDSKGSNNLNDNLSLDRAKAIAIYLMKSGVSANRITIGGKGEYEPAYINDSESNRTMNRRVEIILEH